MSEGKEGAGRRMRIRECGERIQRWRKRRGWRDGKAGVGDMRMEGEGNGRRSEREDREMEDKG